MGDWLGFYLSHTVVTCDVGGIIKAPVLNNEGEREMDRWRGERNEKADDLISITSLAIIRKGLSDQKEVIQT